MNDASARCKTASERRPAAERGLPSESGDRQLDQPGSSSANEVVKHGRHRARQADALTALSSIRFRA
jgi:hypothetical protein